MNILQAIQVAFRRTGLTAPSVAYTSTDPNVIQMLAFMNQAGQEVAAAMEWPELSKEYTFDLVSAQASYSIAADFNYMLFDTLWNRDQTWPLIGPLTPQEWQTRKSGLSTASVRQRYRWIGQVQSGYFYVDPTPDSDNAGETLALEYQSANWIKPASSWSASASIVSTGLYRWYAGNCYVSASTGTTGSTAPTHQSGTATDGGVNWTATVYDEITADTDILILEPDLVIEGARWMFKRENGLDYEGIKTAWADDLRARSTDKKSASVVDFRCPRRSIFLGPANIPDTGYGS